MTTTYLSWFRGEKVVMALNFILKNKLDFPDYTEGLAKGPFVQQEADFIQKTLA